jgi:hypothetical protein
LGQENMFLTLLHHQVLRIFQVFDVFYIKTSLAIQWADDW